MAKKRATSQEILQVRAAMHIAFPACFAPKGGKKKPLKIGIRQDLMVQARELFPAMSRRLIDNFLSDYCRGHNYLKAMVKGAVRVDLDGGFAGFVSASDAIYSKDKLASMKSGGTVEGKAADEPTSPAERLAQLRKELQEEFAHQKLREMGDDWYYTNGSKQKDDAIIASLQRQIRELEAALA